MSFMDYVQSLWGPSTPSAAPTTSSGISGLFSSPSTPHGSSAQQLGSGVWPLSAQVREDMKRGTRFNMKVVLRGSKGTGKSTLLARLTGHPLPPSYTPSTELVASTMRLQAEHTAPNEGVKVDIWEAVEEGRQRSASSSSPNAATRNLPSVQLQEVLRVAADARLLDVYAGAHLVIFMVDPRQRASWDYARQETLCVPPTCCVLYALNFADATTASPAEQGSVVTADEVQAWCGRVRRATTSLVHRMLEGRQAAPEFSVRPMTAVLSALTGRGIMGVIRALHVASTLLRIATEEVRVMRLFALVARQQSVAVHDGGAATVTAQPTGTSPPHAAIDGGSASVGAAEEGTTAPAHAQNHSGELMDHSAQSALQPAITPGSAAAPPQSTTAAAAALRTEHRATVPTLPHDTLGGYKGAGSGATRMLTEAEAMRLFLGGSDSDNSKERSRHSSRSSSVASGTHMTILTRPAVKPHSAVTTRTLPQRAATTTIESRDVVNLLATPEGTVGVDEAKKDAVSCGALTSNEPAADPLSAADEDGATTMQRSARPPAEDEMMRVLVTTMVHDVAAPTDDFFGSDVDNVTESQDAAAAEASKSSQLPITDAAAVIEEDDVTPLFTERNGEMRARPLCTQRVVHRAPSATAAPPAPNGGRNDTSPLLGEVSAIVAQMTAALAAGVASRDTTDGTAAAEVAAEKTSVSERRVKKPSSKALRHTADGPESRHGHSHRKKHRESRGGRGKRRVAEEGEEEAETAEKDDGGFEIVLL